MSTTQGRRIYPIRTDELGHEWYRPEPGDYYREHGIWSAIPPNGLRGNLVNHDVLEHEDGTITVSPSILVDNGAGGQSWHGYLERGVWRDV